MKTTLPKEEEIREEPDFKNETIYIPDIAFNIVKQWGFMLFHNEEIEEGNIFGQFRELKTAWMVSLDARDRQEEEEEQDDDGSWNAKRYETPFFDEIYTIRFLNTISSNLEEVYKMFRDLMTTMRRTSPGWKKTFDDNRIVCKADRYFWAFFF